MVPQLARATVLKTREEAEKLARKAAPYALVAYGICPKFPSLKLTTVLDVSADYCHSRIGLCECIEVSKPYVPIHTSFKLVCPMDVFVSKRVAVNGCDVIIKALIFINFTEPSHLGCLESAERVYEVTFGYVNVGAECGFEISSMHYDFRRSLTYEHARCVAYRPKFLDHEIVVPYPQYLAPTEFGPLRGIEKIEVDGVVIGSDFIEEHVPSMIDAIPEISPECVVRLKSLLDLYP